MLQFGNYDLDAPSGKKSLRRKQEYKKQMTQQNTKELPRGDSKGVCDFWIGFCLQQSAQECSSMAMLLALPSVPHPKYH